MIRPILETRAAGYLDYNAIVLNMDIISHEAMSVNKGPHMFPVTGPHKHRELSLQSLNVKEGR